MIIIISSISIICYYYILKILCIGEIFRGMDGDRREEELKWGKEKRSCQSELARSHN